VEEDAVTDDVPVVVGRRELLGAVHRGWRSCSCRVGEGFSVSGLALLLDHVVRLVESTALSLPGRLLVAPVGELARHDG
jgi:hypothetical protein